MITLTPDEIQALTKFRQDNRAKRLLPFGSVQRDTQSADSYFVGAVMAASNPFTQSAIAPHIRLAQRYYKFAHLFQHARACQLALGQ